MKQSWDDLCAFRVFPNKCLTDFQLFELADDYIQEEIRRKPNQTICSSSTGWYSEKALKNLRWRVVLRFLSVYPQSSAESLLKSAFENFEKTKKTRFLVNEPKPGEHSERILNQEPSSEEDKSDDTNDDEVEEEEEEEAEENVDDGGADEMDRDDPTYLGEEDADFSLQSDSYLGAENISRNYLLELFGSFPSINGASNQLPVVDSETEYEIYEQDSDDNNSDDN